MAADAYTSEQPTRPRNRGSSVGWWWLPPLVAYLALRLVSALFMIALAHRQPDLSGDPTWHVSGGLPADPSYWQLATNWDGQWYRSIALMGYPTGDTAFTGPVQQNEYAFFPLYPILVGLIVRWSGISFEVVGPMTSLVAGAVAVVLLYRWLARTRGSHVALVAVVVLSAFPSSPAMQLAYSDSLAMVFLVIALRAAIEHRWWLLVGISVPLSLTRPVMLPLGLFVLAVVVWEGRRALSGARAIDRAGLATAAFVGATSFAWPAIAWALTGIPSAYFTAAGAWVRAGGLRGAGFGGCGTSAFPSWLFSCWAS